MLNDPRRTAEAQAIRDRLSAIAVAEAGVGTELALAEAAEPPSAQASPRPFRNAVLAASRRSSSRHCSSSDVSSSARVSVGPASFRA